MSVKLEREQWIWNTLDKTVEDHVKKNLDWKDKIVFGPPIPSEKTTPEMLQKMQGVYFIKK